MIGASGSMVVPTSEAFSSANELLHGGFLATAERWPDATALEAEGERLTYAALRARAGRISAALSQHTPPGGEPLTAVFAQRSTTTFAGILAALLAGHGYVPLNRTFPASRTRSMLVSANARALVVDAASSTQLESILDGIEDRLVIILPDLVDIESIARRWPAHLVLGANDLAFEGDLGAVEAKPDSLAYLLFTSGSTGVPKGVGVTHRNATHFLRAIRRRYEVTTTDRFSQMFDTTFDLSVFDMFLAWHDGACVVCPSELTIHNPDKYIREAELTVWASVPSVVGLMKRFGVLKPGRYSTLRISMFCGEPLPVDYATAWASAAPMSVLDNLYGPTELTVACTAYRWEGERSRSQSLLNIVPIGHELPGLSTMVVDEGLREVEPDSEGELLVSGPQVTPGYWNDHESTAASYITPRGRTGVFFRTGDRVRRPIGDGPLRYVGRRDHQVKVLGYRVELGEVESRLREETGVHEAVALPWPKTPTGALGIVAFVVGSDLDDVAVRTSLSAKLPKYAVPHTIHVLPELPLNVNGKIDRGALLRLLDA